MKKEVNLWIENDIPIGMIYDGDFYHITKQKQVKYQVSMTATPVSKKTQERLTANTKKGKTLENHRKLGAKYIGKCDGMRIIKQLVDELKGVFHETKRKAIIKKWYPYVSDDTLKRYSVTYASFKNGKRDKKKYKKRPPENTYAYSKTYGTYIKKDEVKKVMNAIRTVEYNYKPTSDAIVEKTGMRKYRILATIGLLIDENKVGFEVKNGTPIYFDKGFVTQS